MRWLAGLALLTVAAPAGAVEFSGTATTIARAFDLLHVELRENDQPIRRVTPYLPVDQLLTLRWDDAGRRGAWSFDISARYRDDLAGGQSRWQDDDADLLLARARWRSREGLLGLTLGRQQSITSFGWHAFDGARVDFDRAPRMRGFVQAGIPVDLFGGGAPDASDFTWATGVTGILPRAGSIGVDYEIRRDDGHVMEETAGLDAAFRVKRTNIAANADYSLLLATFGETSVSVAQEVRRRHVVEGRFTRVRPVFPADSLFAVFELNAQDESRLTYEFRGDSGLRVGGFVAREDFEDADLAGPQGIRRLAATLRWEGARRGVHRSELGWQDGFSGGRVAIAHDSDWALNPRWRVGTGLSIHRFDNRFRLKESDEVVTARARLRHDHDGRWHLALQAEQHVGRDRNTLRGTLVFGVNFGDTRGDLPWWGGAFTGSRPRRAAPSPEPGSDGADRAAPGEAE